MTVIDLHIKGYTIRAKLNPELLATVEAGRGVLQEKRTEWWDLSSEERDRTPAPPWPISALDLIPAEALMCARALGFGSVGSAHGPNPEGYVTYTFRGE